MKTATFTAQEIQSASFRQLRKIASEYSIKHRVDGRSKVKEEYQADLLALLPAEAAEEDFFIYAETKTEIKAVRPNTKLAGFVELMSRPEGATMTELLALNPKAASVRVYFSYDLPLKGFGVYRRNGRYHATTGPIA